MKCRIKRPKFKFNKNYTEKKYFILYFNSFIINSKKKLGLIQLTFSNIEETSRDFYMKRNLIPFYRRNNINLTFIRTNEPIKNKTYFFFISNSDDLSILNRYLNNTISNDYFCLKIKHLFKGFFQNRYNQFHH
jgi:hypothetical protein